MRTYAISAVLLVLGSLPVAGAQPGSAEAVLPLGDDARGFPATTIALELPKMTTLPITAESAAMVLERQIQVVLIEPLRLEEFPSIDAVFTKKWRVPELVPETQHPLLGAFDKHAV